MFGNYILAFLLAHLISDFLIQTDKICIMKITPGKLHKGLLLHLLGFFITHIIIFLFFLGHLYYDELLYIGIMSGVHGIIDYIKSKYTIYKQSNNNEAVNKKKEPNLTIEEILITDRISYNLFGMTTNRTKTIKQINQKEKLPEGSKYSNRWTIYIFFIDQIAHYFVIIIISLLLFDPPNMLFFIHGYIERLMGFYFLFLNNTVRISESLILIKKEILGLILFLMATSVSSVVIKTIMNGIKDGNSLNIKSGRYIGQLERVLTIFIILAGAWQALAVLYGAKTAIRFEQAKDDPEFAEYYILGTLLSALFGTLSAIAIKVAFY
ncbi:DUF3307 domain-containing protein [Desulfosporosinus shakirovi]|uniref:DUF3307 domain-containing protein n=1 Tax=Desulfosporosinus shakirovi TaxID=2885154 RepID=UPI001E568505|nr:DUF3307 domain-containing protein [Desulfosporosinus sp. SRJS8]MCB8816130.1 DUF3307 domain-containing protein [Desulfosporosinus sp. SRJS8]